MISRLYFLQILPEVRQLMEERTLNDRFLELNLVYPGFKVDIVNIAHAPPLTSKEKVLAVTGNPWPPIDRVGIERGEKFPGFTPLTIIVPADKQVGISKPFWNACHEDHVRFVGCNERLIFIVDRVNRITDILW